MKRPISISIISWFSIVISILALVGLAYTARLLIINELGTSVDMIAILALPAIIYIAILISSIAMLRRISWGRIAYIVLALLLLAMSVSIGGFSIKFVGQTIVILGFIYLLLRKTANQYFS